MDENANVKKRQAIRFHIMAIILIIIFAFCASQVVLQNDTYYTIKIGEYITQNGVTMQEPFAWHEGLEYTFPHWAYDLMTYKIYQIGGMDGIYISTIILASILGLAIYYTNVKLNKNRIYSLVLTIICLYLMRNYIAARAQLFTFILFILEIYFIEKFLENRKIRYAIGLIIIPILIANFHTATFYFYFVLYLPYIAEWVYCIIRNIIDKHHYKKQLKNAGQQIEEINKNIEDEEPYKINTTYRKNTKYLIVIMFICLFTGFLTPLGTTPYTYLIKTMQGISMKNISEHLPLTLINNKDMICTLIFVFAILIFTDTKIRLCDLFMLGGLLFLTFSSQRQASMFVLIGVVIFNRMFTSMTMKHAPKMLERLEPYTTTILGMITVIGLSLTLSIYTYAPKIGDKYIDEKAYPVKAATWIKENLDVNNIKLYNAYNYGSYLLYQDIPVFIDSRCDLYMPEFNENVEVFKDFLKIDSIGYTHMEERMNKYGFTHYLIKQNSKLQVYLEAKGSQYYEKIYPLNEEDDQYFCIYERK